MDVLSIGPSSMPEMNRERLAALRKHAQVLSNGYTPDDPEFAHRGTPFVKPVNQGSAAEPYVAYTVRVAGDQTVCIVPPFDQKSGDRASETTAHAISTAGRDLFEAVTEIERLREENESLQRYWNEAIVTLQNQIRLCNMIVDEHQAMVGKYADTVRKLSSAAESLFDAPVPEAQR